ncbi:phage tail domain-containing protein [Rummeliibacillus pycnus]|uniref:phage tail domain-containing protein n=1 Tax=Rummeliibacillus pycnus TaxID=101070 RepID=UPI0037CA8026
METATFTNSRGESVKFADAPFYLQEITGLGDVSAQIQSQKSPFQDGSTYLDAILDEREIGIKFLIVADNSQSYGDVSKMRTQVARILNPKLGPGILRYENDAVVRIITCVADGVPEYPDGSDRVEKIQSASVSLVAHNPFWKSLAIEEEPAFKPLFQFPFSQPFQMGIQRDERIIDNNGDAPAPLQIEFFGPALNPMILNRTTNQIIKVNQELLEGERMIIDTDPDDFGVYFVDEKGNARNVMHWLDLDSSLSTFRLTLGENEIAYTADSNVQGAILNLSWKKLYNAV